MHPLPPWVPSLGTVTGVVGLVTGIISLRRVKSLKALDLRVELKKLVVDTDEALTHALQFNRDAHQSRVAVLAATGLAGSSAMDNSREQVARDQSVIVGMRSAFDALRQNDKLKSAELERRLVEVHSLHRRTQRLIEKYDTEIAKDDKQRDRIATRFNR